MFHYHPHVFNTIYTILILLYQTFLMSNGEDGIQIAWMAAFFFPNFVYTATGSIWHSIFNTFGQLVLIQTIYQAEMMRALNQMSTEEFLKAMTRNSQEIILFTVLFTVLIHFSIKDAHHKIHVANKSKEEAERQKVFLLGFSHELRNLINSQIGNIKLIDLEVITQKAKDLVINAEVCSELLLHLVNNILDTGKAEIGDLEINPIPTRIYDTIERIWGSLLRADQEKRTSWTYKYPKKYATSTKSRPL